MDLDLAESDLVLDDEPEITFSDKDLLLSNAEKKESLFPFFLVI
jgi:hypothetical protein